MGIVKEKEWLKARRFRVLLIEDDKMDAEWVLRLLENFDGAVFDTQWADTVAKGIKLLEKGSFDVIVSDMKLPDGCGIEVFRRLYKCASQVPITLLTGAVEEESIATEAVRMGAQDFMLKKNICSERLVRSLLYAIERNRLLTTKQHIVNVVSHEVRTPLAILRENIAQISEGLVGPLSPKQKDYLRISLETVDRVIHTAAGLLELARLGASGDQMRKKEFSITEMARKAMGQFEARSRKKSIRLRGRFLETDSQYVYADPDQITRVFTNLISNALKYTDSGLIEIAVKDRDQMVECSIRDTGIGIKKEDLPRVFKKFERIGENNRKAESIGLGLSICKEIIDQHGGLIWVESRFGEGTRFSFTLPKENPAAVAGSVKKNLNRLAG